MKITQLAYIYACLMLCSQAVITHADQLSWKSLPQTEGTPIHTPDWQITHFVADDNGLAWAWLAETDSTALILYPRAESSQAVVTPWGESVFGNPDKITLIIHSSKEKTWEVGRFGGAVTVNGAHIVIEYLPDAASELSGNFYDVLSLQELNIRGEHTANMVTSGQVEKIVGSDSLFDELYGPAEDNAWTFSEESIQVAGTATQRPIVMTQIESFFRGESKQDRRTAYNGINTNDSDQNYQIIASVLNPNVGK